MAQRIKGQEVSLSIVSNGAEVGSIKAIKSFEFTYRQEIQQEGYLGETAERVDAIYNGIEGNFEYHTEDANVWVLIGQLVDKARRRTSGLTVSIRATLNYPDGRRVKVIFPEVEFGEIPVSVGGRSDYVSQTMNFACTECKTLIT